MPDPGPTERLEEVRLDGLHATRWAVGEAEAVWVVAEGVTPRDLHVLYTDDGALAPGLAARGDAVLWLPGPPRRPEGSEWLLRRARRPPRRFALLHGWAAVDAARLGRFGDVPGGRVIVHAGADPESAAYLAVFDSRVDALVGLPDRLRSSGGWLWSLAACKAASEPAGARSVAPMKPPRPASRPLPSPEPAPWTVSLAPRRRVEASPPPPSAWVVHGPSPEGLVAPHVDGGPGQEWDWAAEDTIEVGPGVLAALGVPAEQVGFLGVGAEGVYAMRWALATGGVAVAVSSPVTLWTDAAAAPPWPVWVFGGGVGAADDPWWLAEVLGDRLVLVDPRDALGRPWAGPAPPAPVADSVDAALSALAGSPPR